MNDKFTWQKGDIQIAKTQCEFCAYYNAETPDKCEMYEKKPDEVIKNEVRCKKAKNNNPAPWEK